MPTVQLGLIDYLILAVYFAFVLGIGWVLRRTSRPAPTSSSPAARIPAWIAGLAFISANLGAQEVIGMGACGRQVRHADLPLLLARRRSRRWCSSASS